MPDTVFSLQTINGDDLFIGVSSSNHSRAQSEYFVDCSFRKCRGTLSLTRHLSFFHSVLSEMDLFLKCMQEMIGSMMRIMYACYLLWVAANQFNKQ